MSAAKTVDEYLDALPEPKRATLQRLRAAILEVAPGAIEVIAYGVPAFKLDGTAIAGFAAFKQHLSYLPHSGSVLGTLEAETSVYEQTPGSLHCAINRPLPKTLVRKLIAARRREIAEAAEATQTAKRSR